MFERPLPQIISEGRGLTYGPLVLARAGTTCWTLGRGAQRLAFTRPELLVVAEMLERDRSTGRFEMTPGEHGARRLATREPFPGLWSSPDPIVVPAHLRAVIAEDLRVLDTLVADDRPPIDTTIAIARLHARRLARHAVERHHIVPLDLALHGARSVGPGPIC